MLSAESRAFFSLVSEAAFANPFGAGRDRLDRRIAGAPRIAERPEVVRRLLSALGGRLDATRRSLRAHEGPDRELLEHAVLFETFHRFADAFDAHIEKQLARPGPPLRIDFARDALASLTGAGLAPPDAARSFAIFFQLRRAFHFIEHTLPGASPSMRRLRERLWTNVFTHDGRLYARSLWRNMEDFSTFLTGGTGTGKGLAAAAIGRSAFIPFDEVKGAFATSFVDAFVSINLSQFPESLVESELFGHKKGAFTGAAESHRGVLERTSPHGAILLDEIGETTGAVQIKLLRVLQERTFSPVGGHDVIRFHGRVVAATNRSLEELRRASAFREDFYYRLCSDVIALPSLAQRLEEDPAELDLLLAFIVGRLLGERSPAVAARVKAAVERDLGASYPWPGNVRELEQCARRVILTGAYEGDPRLRAATLAASALAPGAAPDESARAVLTRHCRRLYAEHGTYEEVARRTALDRRTVKRYLDAPEGADPSGALRSARRSRA